MTPRLMVTRLLETVDDTDSDLKDLLGSGIPDYPGYEITAHEFYWVLWKGDENIGQVYYDTPDSLPTENPELKKMWEKVPFTAISHVFHAETKVFSTFAEAAEYLIKSYENRISKPVTENAVHASNLEDSLRSMLTGIYQHVTVKCESIQPAALDARKWTIRCQCDTPLSLPPLQESQTWSKCLKAWVGKWAIQEKVGVSNFRAYGAARKDVVFSFITSSPLPSAITESSDDVKDDLINLTADVNWQERLYADLHQFHPFGTLYTTTGQPESYILVSIETYFPPNKNNYARRAVDFITKWVAENTSMDIGDVKTESYQPTNADYPRWIILVHIRSKEVLAKNISLAVNPLHDFDEIA